MAATCEATPLCGKTCGCIHHLFVRCTNIYSMAKIPRLLPRSGCNHLCNTDVRQHSRRLAPVTPWPTPTSDFFFFIPPRKT